MTPVVTQVALQQEALKDSGKANPFQVYPVRSLAEIDNVAAVTVPTPEVLEVEAAVEEFAAAFGAPAEPYAKLLLAAKGDFGTGKTHLMLYARSVLATRLAERRTLASQPAVKSASPSQGKPTGNGDGAGWGAAFGEPIAVMAVSSEAPIEAWYQSELGPLLIEVAKPRTLVRDLLTRQAVEVAQADSDPDVRKLAPLFQQSRKALYEAFREPGSFDISEVDERFSAAIARACPRTSRSFRRAIEALRWEETSELAEDWLAGNELSTADMARIGIRLVGDPAARAANTICAIASISRELGRPFALFIDEFEHLTRYDKRNRSKRNITWTKRLVESLARRGAMVFISGHWKAWRQQGDFLDRFVGGRPIQLVRLTASDVLDVVSVRAGPNAWPGFTANAARWVAEATSGNIRRVMTVLYDLWNNPDAPIADVTEEAVRLAAQRRLQPGSEIGIVPALEAAMRANGATLRRDDPFADITAYLGQELRLAVKVIHARDELALIGDGRRFAEIVTQLRIDKHHARGLVVLLGAVVEKHVLTLDAAFPETDMVSGEDPDIVKLLPEIVGRALAPTPKPVQPPTPEAQEALDITLIQAVDRANAQAERSETVLGTDDRSKMVRQALAPDPVELHRQNEAARLRVLKNATSLQRTRLTQFFGALLREPLPILFVMLGVTGSIATDLLRFYLADRMYFFGAIGYVFSALIAATGLMLGARLFFDLIEFRTYWQREITSIYEDDTIPARAMLGADKAIGEALSAYGPRRGLLRLIEQRNQGG